ncbi:MAG: MbnP family protein [bacterium]
MGARSTRAARRSGGAGGAGGAGGGGAGGVVAWAARGGATSLGRSRCGSPGRVGDAPLRATRGLRAWGPTAPSPLDFRLYIHDLRFLTAEGEAAGDPHEDGLWQRAISRSSTSRTSPAHENGTEETNTEVVGTVPAGRTLASPSRWGCPSSSNHADVALALPLNLSGLFWNWNGGYKFVRGRPGRGAETPFNIHLGSTGEADEAGTITGARPNRPEITLPAFDAATQVSRGLRRPGHQRLGVNAGERLHVWPR